MADATAKPNEDQDSPRVKMAEDYFKKEFNLRGQRSWYSKKASRNKKYYQWLGFIIIVAAASTGVIQIWAPSPPDKGIHWTNILAALLGALVVISKGVEHIWNFDGTWLGYRKASEGMNREMRLFINGAMAYENCANDREAFLLLIKRVEGIIAEEQNNFMSNQESNSNPQAGSKKNEEE